MNYAAIYQRFILSRRGTECALVKPYDVHHIRPRALGGSDDPENLIRLAPEDHLFAHILLARIHGGQMVRAAYGMLRGKRYAGRRTRREYDWLRREASKEAGDRVRRANERRGRAPRLGIKHTDEAKAKISATKRANPTPDPGAPHKLAFVERARHPRSDQHRARIGEAARRFYANNEHHAKGRPRARESVERAEATKRALREAGYISPLKGRPRSDETRSRMSEGKRIAHVRKMHSLGLMG